MRVQLTVGTMTGGAMLLNEPMDELLRDADARGRLAAFGVLPHAEGTRCIPLDPFPKGGGAPSIWATRVVRDFETWWVVAVFNWADAFQDYTVPLDALEVGGGVHAYEFWRQEYAGRFRGEIVVKDVPAHGCRLFSVRRALRTPQVLGTNMHILQGATEIEDWAFQDDALEITVRHWFGENRRIALKAPKTMRVAEVTTDAWDYLVDGREAGVVILHFNARRGARRTTFRVRFTR